MSIWLASVRVDRISEPGRGIPPNVEFIFDFGNSPFCAETRSETKTKKII